MAAFTTGPIKSWRNYVWLAWFSIQVPVILFIDALDKYPAWLVEPEGAPLHFLYVFRLNYISDYNDPIAQWTPETGNMNWVPLFIWFELIFSLPLAFYSLYALGVKRAGTTGSYELLMLVYAFETAFTTAVCIHEVQYWDPDVYSPAQKNVFIYQLFGPWLVVPSLMFIDMYRRLTSRFGPVDVVKKTQ